MGYRMVLSCLLGVLICRTLQDCICPGPVLQVTACGLHFLVAGHLVPPHRPELGL